MNNDNNTNSDSHDLNAYAAPYTASAAEEKKKKGSFTLIEFVVVLAIIGILYGMLIPFTSSGREPARRTVCLNNMRQIALAMYNYETANGHFPPAYVADENGEPMHSWRVLILPFLEQDDLYSRYSMDEPWDGPNNSKLHDEIVEVYLCPSSTSAEYCSDYAVVTGPETGFNADEPIGLEDITDGSSNTIMLVEIFNPDYHWMEPRDISAKELLGSGAEYVKPSHPGTRNIALFDGSTHSIEVETSTEKVKKLVSIAGGEV